MSIGKGTLKPNMSSYVLTQVIPALMARWGPQYSNSMLEHPKIEQPGLRADARVFVEVPSKPIACLGRRKKLALTLIVTNYYALVASNAHGFAALHNDLGVYGREVCSIFGALSASTTTAFFLAR